MIQTSIFVAYKIDLYRSKTMLEVRMKVPHSVVFVTHDNSFLITTNERTLHVLRTGEINFSSINLSIYIVYTVYIHIYINN